MESKEGIVTAVHYRYQGAAIEATDVFFNDGTMLALDGHWTFLLGKTYRIEHADENPADVQSATITEML